MLTWSIFADLVTSIFCVPTECIIKEVYDTFDGWNIFIGCFLQMSGSVWTLMSTQLNFAISMTTAIISLLFSGGTVVLNFIVSVVSCLWLIYCIVQKFESEKLWRQFIGSLPHTKCFSSETHNQFIIKILLLRVLPFASFVCVKFWAPRLIYIWPI